MIDRGHDKFPIISRKNSHAVTLTAVQIDIDWKIIEICEEGFKKKTRTNKEIVNYVNSEKGEDHDRKAGGIIILK